MRALETLTVWCAVGHSKDNNGNGAERVRSPENGNGTKHVLLDISAKSQWILAFDTAFERSS